MKLGEESTKNEMKIVKKEIRFLNRLKREVIPMPITMLASLMPMLLMLLILMLILVPLLLLLMVAPRSGFDSVPVVVIVIVKNLKL